MDRQTTSSNIKNKLIKFKQTLEQSGIAVDRMYLFGSQAKGNATKESDIDVCVISSDFGKNYFAEEVTLSLIANKIDPYIEPHPLNLKDFNNKYHTFSQEVRQHGQII